MSSIITEAAAAEFFAAIDMSPRTITIKNGMATIEAYISESKVRAAKSAGWPVACRKFGKVWTVACPVRRFDECVESEDNDAGRLLNF
jgi:hypothetical protein